MDFLEGNASKLLPAGTKVNPSWLKTFSYLVYSHLIQIIKVIQVHCVALAPPPVFRPGGGQGLSTRVVDAIEIYINNCDIVPRLSLASIAHLLACLRAVDELKLSLGTQFDILIGEPGPQFPKVGVRPNNYLSLWNFGLCFKVVEAVQGARQDSFAYLEVNSWPASYIECKLTTSSHHAGLKILGKLSLFKTAQFLTIWSQHPGRIYYLKRNSTKEKLRTVFRQVS